MPRSFYEKIIKNKNRIVYFFLSRLIGIFLLNQILIKRSIFIKKRFNETLKPAIPPNNGAFIKDVLSSFCLFPRYDRHGNEMYTSSI